MRIRDALRSAGVDAWFDQSELRGGDSWDAQIKKQIHECALFIPIISAHTNARGEGYFRREWNLAARRLLDMTIYHVSKASQKDSYYTYYRSTIDLALTTSWDEFLNAYAQ